MKRIGLLLLLVVLVSGSVFSATIKVPEEHPTIQAGIDTAVDGDTVLVHPGTYIENINFKGKTIVVGSLYLTTNDESYISSTIIDADMKAPVALFESNETREAKLVGLTLQNGWCGIKVDSLGPTLKKLIVRNNGAIYRGSGFQAGCYGNLNFLITDCIFEKNDHAKTVIYACNVNSSGIEYYEIKNTKVLNNQPNRSAVELNGNKSSIENSLIANNSGYGIEVINAGSGTEIRNCTIANNTKNGIVAWNNIYASIIDVKSTILWQNGNYGIEVTRMTPATILNVSNSLIPNGIGGISSPITSVVNYDETNIAADPLFVDAPNGDYQLLDSSPAIGAGILDENTPKVDIEGSLRPSPADSKPDIGAYENLLTKSSPVVSKPTEDTVERLIRVPEDQPTIQSAINAAEKGEKILVSVGTYDEVIKLKSDISIKGESRTKTILQSEATKIINLDNVSNVQIENLTVDGRTLVHTPIAIKDSDNIRLNNITVKAGAFYNLKADTSEALSINECRFRYGNEYGVSIDRTGGTVSDSVFRFGNRTLLSVSNSKDEVLTVSNCEFFDDQEKTWTAIVCEGQLARDKFIGNNIKLSRKGYPVIKIRGSAQPVFRRNKIEGGRISIKIEATATPDFGTKSGFGYNHILPGTEFRVVGEREEEDGPIHMVGNYWHGLPSQIQDTIKPFLLVEPTLGNPSIYIRNKQVSQDQVFTVSINVDRIYNLAGWSANLEYDPEILELQAIEQGGAFNIKEEATFQEKGIINQKEGLLENMSWTYLRKGGVSGSGALAILTFNSLKSGESDLHLKKVKFGDPSGKEMPIEVTDATITVSGGPPCDVNADGTVNIFDLILVAQVFGQKVDTRADTNDDGVVNIFDLIVVAGCFGQGAAPSIVKQPIAMFSMIENWIRLAEQANGGSIDFNQGISVLREILQSLKPEETVLMANYPNPFNPETWIPYHLGQESEVVINIYDTTGKIVRTLDMGFQSFGYYASRDKSAYWDGRTENGEFVSSGTYFYQIQTGDYTETRKMVILK